MVDILFYIFAAITLISALLMVVSPNAVNGAMCMIVSFVGTAALFVLLEAYFLAVIQILVYAGAVMVLFLFIIMLLDVDKGEGTGLSRSKLGFGAAVVGFSLLAVMVSTAFVGGAHVPEPEVMAVASNPTGTGEGFEFTTSAKSFGYSLFSKYMLPFQMTGFLLLAGMIGVIVVSKKSAAELEADAQAAQEGGNAS